MLWQCLKCFNCWWHSVFTCKSLLFEQQLLLITCFSVCHGTRSTRRPQSVPRLSSGAVASRLRCYRQRIWGSRCSWLSSLQQAPIWGLVFPPVW